MHQATLADALTELSRRAAHGADGLPDAELLRRYAEARDEAAFGALMRRHGRVVWGAALRRTADRQAAEDVFQATFLALARRAGRLHTRTSLAGWLYTVGVRLARRAARRKPIVPLDHAPDPRPGPVAELSARELLTAIDDELARLPERLRMPVVLCCLDGLSRDEAAARLGCSFHVLKGRLERGRELLRKRLVDRGVSLPAVLGGLIVLPVTVPPEVNASTATAVLQGTPRPAATALAKTIAGGRRAGITAVVLAGLLGLGLSLMPGNSPPKQDPKPPAKEPEPAPVGDTVAVRVLRDGKPAPGAKVWVTSRQDKEKPEAVVAGADGLVRLPIEPEGRRYLSLFARDPDGRIGEARLHERDTTAWRDPVVHLLAVGELTGRFVTADGKPIAGAELKATQFSRPDDEHQENRPSYVNVPEWDPTYATKTDGDGRFRIPSAPVGYRSYVTVSTVGYGQGYLVPEAGKPVEATLAPAGSVRVKLVGPGDVAATKGLSWWLNTTRDPGKDRPAFVGRANGEFNGSAEFRIANLSPGRYQLTLRMSAKHSVRVVAAGEVTVESGGTTDLPMTVEPMAKATGRIVDAATGKGIPKAQLLLRLRDEARKPGMYDAWLESDVDGRFVAYGPPGEWVAPSLYSPPPGYSLPAGEIAAAKLDAKTPHTFPDLKFHKTVVLRGLVVDEAGKPVVTSAVWPGRVNARMDGPDVITAKADGSFTIADLDPDDVVAPRVKKGNAVNVPTPIEVKKADGPVRIEVSEKNACRVRGRVTDAAGKPLAGATVGVTWHYWGLGLESRYGSSRGVESVTTDTDGRFESGALWPRDKYHFTVRRERYGNGESKQVTGEAGQIHDLGTVKLVAIGGAVRGRVVGTDGKPLAGVSVFNRGDGLAAMTATTGADGSFTLTGFFDAPGFVFAKMGGYRFTYAVARPGGDAVTVTMRKTSEPPVALVSMDQHNAALAKFTRHLLETLWADREQLDGFERNVFRAMARFDPATATKWRDDEKARTKGKVDLTKALNEVEQERTLLKTAREDIDEALALIPNGKDRSAVRRVVTLAEELLAHDKAKALRAAEEAAVRARGLDPMERAWLLARAGDIAVKAGNAAGGKKLVADAAGLAGEFPTDERNNYYRGLAAAVVAAHDEPAAHKLIDAIKNADQYNRALALLIDRLAETDSKRAEELLGKFRDGADYSSARLAVGFRLAATDPDRAERIINETREMAYRVQGLARLATKVKDRERAWKLIDRAFALIDEHPDQLRSWSNYGGEPAIAAVVAARAREVGHPDVAAFVGRALAMRSPQRTWTTREEREQQLVSVATVLAFADPPTARVVLSAIAPPAEFAARAAKERRDWLFAVALADPDGAKAVVDAVWKAAKASCGGGRAVSGTGLIELTSILTESEGRLATLATYGSIPSVPDRPD